ncbi:MAG: DUF4397 domain-containing protein [Eubacteriales bacterium]
MLNERHTSYIRLLHAAPTAPTVNIYSDGDNLLAENLDFGEFTPYIPVQPGEYDLAINPVGAQEPVLTSTLTIPDKMIFTIAVIGTPPNLEVFVIEDTPSRTPANRLGLRFVHLSPDTPAVDVRLPNGDIIFEDVDYTEVPNYLFIEPNTYSIQVYPTGTNEMALQVPNIRLKKDRFYTIYAVGLLENTPPLQVLIPLDGNSYITV